MERVELSTVKSDIEAAFDAWTEFNKTDYAWSAFDYMPGARQAKAMEEQRSRTAESRARAIAFLAQCDDPAVLAAMLHDRLARLKPGSRLDVFDAVASGYCIHCGEVMDDVCHCTNDD